MSVKIKVCKEGAVLQQISLTPLKTMLIGRKQDADICIEHPSSSRQHASLVLNAQGVVLTDLGSAHGTFRNQQQLPANQPTKLVDGDVVRFGQSTRTYVVSVGDRSSAGKPDPAAKSGPDTGKAGAAAAKEDSPPPAPRGFNPLFGSSGGGGGGLNSGGKLASVLAMMDRDRQQESGYKRKDRDGEGGVVGDYTRKEMSYSGMGLDAMAARAERDSAFEKRKRPN